MSERPFGPREAYMGRGMPKREPLRRPMPLVDPGQLVIDVYQPERDSFGRVRFFMYWHDDYLPGAPPGTPPVRGQVFYADERVKARKAIERGDKVFMLGRAADDTGEWPDWTGLLLEVSQ